MRVIRLFSIICALAVGFSCIHAQSVDYAKSLINQGRYLDAAKQLRPLADGGNAEAQLLAAKLFLEGKGVQKNEAQGIKYAKMSAANGNDDVALELFFMWKAIDSNTLINPIIQIVTDYVRKRPSTQNSSKTWAFYGMMLIEGWGIPANVAQGIDILEKNTTPEAGEFLKESSGKYKSYLLSKSGYSSLVDYVTQQSYVSDAVLMCAVGDYEKRNVGKSPYTSLNEWHKPARSNNKYAQYIFAQILYDYYCRSYDKMAEAPSGSLTLAKMYSKKAFNAGVQKARLLANELNNKFHVGEQFKEGTVYWVSNDGRESLLYADECRTLDKAGARQWEVEANRSSGLWLPTAEHMSRLLKVLKSQGKSVAGYYWVDRAAYTLCQYDANGNIVKQYYGSDIPSSVGATHKAYMTLYQHK